MKSVCSLRGETQGKKGQQSTRRCSLTLSLNIFTHLNQPGGGGPKQSGQVDSRHLETMMMYLEVGRRFSQLSSVTLARGEWQGD